MKIRLYILRGGLWYVFLFVFYTSFAQEPWIDILPDAAPSSPQELTMVGNTLYFTAFSLTGGREPHKVDCAGGIDTDPTDNLLDIVSGFGGSSPGEYVEWDGELYFVAAEPIGGGDFDIAIYNADASCNFSVANNSSLGSLLSSSISSLRPAGDYLFFNNSGNLSKLDMMGNVTTIVDGSSTTISGIGNLEAFGSSLLFGANASGTSVLYEMTDLSTNTAGVLLDNVGETIGDPDIIIAGSYAYFIGDSPTSGNDVLYCYDGTNPPFVVMDGGSALSFSSNRRTIIGNTLYIADSADNVYAISNGMVSSLTPSTTASSCDGMSTNNTPSSIQNLVDWNGTLAIITSTGVYTVDGTEIEVFQDGLMDLDNISASSGNTLYFKASSGGSDVLWATDGACPAVVDANVTSPAELIAIPGTNDIFFVGSTTTYGREIYKASVSQILSVEFLDFSATAMESEVVLKWTTLSEIDNAGFEVERSKDALHWETLTFVKGNGTTNDLSQYDFIDSEAFTGTNYYRLRQIDTDGQYSYSDIVTAYLSNSKLEVRTWPNPVQNSLYYTISSEENEEYQVALYNAVGIKVFSEIAFNTGEARIDIAHLPMGNYYLSIYTPSNQFTQQIIKI